jgi:hypothetical protein
MPPGPRPSIPASSTLEGACKDRRPTGADARRLPPDSFRRRCNGVPGVPSTPAPNGPVADPLPPGLGAGSGIRSLAKASSTRDPPSVERRSSVGSPSLLASFKLAEHGAIADSSVVFGTMAPLIRIGTCPAKMERESTRFRTNRPRGSVSHRPTLYVGRYRRDRRGLLTASKHPVSSSSVRNRSPEFRLQPPKKGVIRDLWYP